MTIPDDSQSPAADPGTADGLARRKAWLPTALALAALAGAVLTFYFRLWLPDLVLTRRDAFRLFLPLKHYMAERLAEGELPQWFPYEAMGRPFIGITVTGVFHPFTALYFLLSTHEAYRLSTLLSCLLAALGAFALGRHLTVSRMGSFAAGLAFACSGYVVSLTENLVYLYSICLLPLFFLALDRALERNMAWVGAAALLWASVFLNGDVQTGYYYGFAVLLWSMTRARGFDRDVALRLIGTSVLAALLAGIQLAPAAAILFDSLRADPASFYAQAVYMSTHPLQLVGVVAAPFVPIDDELPVAEHFFGRLSNGGESGGFWAESFYLGVPVTGLALLGAWHRRDLCGFTWLGSLALLLSLGKYGGLYGLFYQVVPFWSAFRHPEKLMGLVSFAVVMLAGAGFDELRKGRGLSALWLVAAAGCAGLAGSLRLDAVSQWIQSTLGAPQVLTHQVTEMAASALLFSAVSAAGVWLVAFGVQRQWRSAQHLCLAVVAIIALDLSRANQAAYHTGPAEIATFTPGLAEAIAQHARVAGPGHFRIMSLAHNRMSFPRTMRESLDLVGITSLVNRQFLEVEHNADFHVESLGSYLSANTKASVALITALQDPVGLDVYARYNVAYVVGRSELLNAPLFARAHIAAVPDYDLALVRNPYRVKPRAYVSRRPEPASAPVDLKALFARKDFLNGEVDVIEQAGRDLPGPSRDGTAEIIRYAPETVAVRVETPAPAVLILVDVFDAGWRAALETGEPMPILRANGAVRAVVVPGGAHVVTFTYETPWLRVGACVSAIGALLCAAVLVVGRRRDVSFASPAPVSERSEEGPAHG
ncbi:MAG: YfhO family protein [Nitrospiraceae bacterium]